MFRELSLKIRWAVLAIATDLVCVLVQAQCGVQNTRRQLEKPLFRRRKRLWRVSTIFKLKKSWIRASGWNSRNRDLQKGLWRPGSRWSQLGTSQWQQGDWRSYWTTELNCSSPLNLPPCKPKGLLNLQSPKANTRVRNHYKALTSLFNVGCSYMIGKATHYRRSFNNNIISISP